MATAKSSGTCAACGAELRTQQHRDAQYCSDACSWQVYYAGCGPRTICAVGWSGYPAGRSLARAVSAAPPSRRRWTKERIARRSVAIGPCRFAIGTRPMLDLVASPRNVDNVGCRRESVWSATRSLAHAASRAAGARGHADRDASRASGRNSTPMLFGLDDWSDARGSVRYHTSGSAHRWSSSATLGRANSVDAARQSISSGRARSVGRPLITSCHSRRAAPTSTRTCSAPVLAVILEKARGF